MSTRRQNYEYWTAPDGRFTLIHITALDGVTQALTADEVPDMVRDYIAVTLGVPEDSFDITEWIQGAPPTDERGNFPVGVLLQVRNGGRILVGHINDVGGVCNDCTTDIRQEDVERHRVVWQPENAGSPGPVL